jgi:hypothetical protein
MALLGVNAMKKSRYSEESFARVFGQGHQMTIARIINDSLVIKPITGAP